MMMKGYTRVISLLLGRSMCTVLCISLGRTHSAVSHSSQCSTIGVTKAVVCDILSMRWCI